MDQLIKLYLDRLTVTGYREGTLRTRRSVLSHLETFLQPKPLALATRSDLQSFLARPLAAESRRSYRSHLRHFYEFAVEEGHVLDSPAEKLPAIRVSPGTPRPIDGADLRLAVGSADQRTRAWLLLMALGGLRCMEVASLEPSDLIETEGGWLLYLRECKGGGTATVPAHEAVVRALLALPVHEGNTWWSCSRHYVSQVISAHLHSLGIRASAHQLRHAAGTAWYRGSGHDLLVTARLMRHQSVRTTQIYAALDPVRPAEVVAAVPSPMAS